MRSPVRSTSPAASRTSTWRATDGTDCRSSIARSSIDAGRAADPRDDPEPVGVDEGPQAGQELRIHAASVGGAADPSGTLPANARHRPAPRRPPPPRSRHGQGRGPGRRDRRRPPSRCSPTTRPRGAGVRRSRASCPRSASGSTAAGIAPLVVHAPYLVNLAGPDPDVFDRSVAVLANELRVAAAWDAAIVNVHLGLASRRGLRGGRPAARRRPVPGARGRRRRRRPASRVVLENGTGRRLGHRLERRGARPDRGRRSSATGVDRDAVRLVPRRRPPLGRRLRRWTSPPASTRSSPSSTGAIGLGRLRMVHLNDSRSERGSRTDRHEHLGAGLIGARGPRQGADPSGPRPRRVPSSRRPAWTEGYDVVNLDRARDLAAGRPLAALPPEAFETPSAKGRSAPAETMRLRRATTPRASDVAPATGPRTDAPA